MYYNVESMQETKEYEMETVLYMRSLPGVKHVEGPGLSGGSCGNFLPPPHLQL